jgi:hypothetical protein
MCARIVVISQLPCRALKTDRRASLSKLTRCLNGLGRIHKIAQRRAIDNSLPDLQAGHVHSVMHSTPFLVSRRDKQLRRT